MEAGLYSLAYRMVSLPGSLVGGAVANVFLPHAAEAYRDGTLDELLINVHLILSRLVMPASIFVAIFAPELFAFVFGEEWRDAGQYAQWLTVMLYVQFIYSPVSTSFGIINRQEVGLLLHISLLIVSVLTKMISL
jgi:O-antigen/teichoic acid export membrane protein